MVRAMSLARREQAVLLALVLAVALLHALTHARLRPLYQVSDEMAYLRAAQGLALADAPPDTHACIAPPDGRPFELGEGGKAGFRRVTAWQLRWLCRDGGADLPLFALRAWNALALPAIALAAWALAWRLTRDRAAALAAATMVAVHPVAAKYAGGVAPDAWANAFSAGALVAFTRIATGGDRWWDLPALVGCTVAGLLWKDTTHFLVPIALAGTGIVVWSHVGRAITRDAAGRLSRRRAVMTGLATVLLAAALAANVHWDDLVTPYLPVLSGGTQAAWESPWTFLRAVADDMLRQAAGFVASSLLSLYRPLVYIADDVWQQPLTPWGVAVTLVVIGSVGIAGGLAAIVRGGSGRRLPAGVMTWWACALLLCAAQPSVRLVLIGFDGIHQGRWLFPMLAPAAAFVGMGLATIARGRAVPAAVAVSLATVWVVIVDVVRHYYAALPGSVATGGLFTRPTGDVDVGDQAITALILATTEAQSPAVTWSILVLLAVATLGLAWAVARRDLPHSHV